jgi:AcrR family transcriptional regulator
MVIEKATVPVRVRKSPGRNKVGSASPREAIILIALKHFARHSYEGASLANIANEVGIKQPLINYYFKTKENLWMEVSQYVWGDVKRAFDSILSDTSDLEPIDVLKVLCRAFIRFSARFPDHPSLVINESRNPGPRFEWLVDNFLRPMHRSIDNIIEAGVKKKQIKPIPAAYLTNVIIMSSAQFFTASKLMSTLYDVDIMSEEALAAQSEHVIEVLFRGMVLS